MLSYLNAGSGSFVALFIVIGVVVVILLMVQIARGPSSGGQDQQSFVPESPDQWLRKLTLAVAGLSNHTMNRQGDMVTITRRATPGWAVLIAIVTFPIGLLALTAKREETAVIMVEEKAGGGSRITFRGKFHEKLIDRINTVIE